MDVTCFFGLEQFWHRAAPEKLVEINRALTRQQRPARDEPAGLRLDMPYRPGSQGLGRSALDHHSARAVAAFADEAYGLLFEYGSHFDPLRLEGGTSVFIPVEFSETIMLPDLWLGSSQTLHRQLVHYASYLGIPMTGNHLEDEVARQINDFEFGADDARFWLMLFEASRLSVQHDVSLIVG
jgi:hypothetical protein